MTGFNFKKIFKDSTLRLLRTKVHYPVPGVAIVHARMEIENQTTTDGKIASHKRNNLFVFVVKKTDNQWVCFSAQNSEILKGAETFLRKEDGTYEAVRYGDIQNRLRQCLKDLLFLD